MSSQLNDPRGVTVDSNGNMYIADYYNQRIRKVDRLTGIIGKNRLNGTGKRSVKKSNVSDT